MTKAGQVTLSNIRYRLTDPVSGVDSWHAEAFGLLVAERFYPDLVVNCSETKSNTYGFFRHRLNLVWSNLEGLPKREPRAMSEQDLQAISRQIPDNGQDGPTGARAVAAGTICLHLSRFLRSRDRGDIALLALAAYAGVFIDDRGEPSAGSTPWAASIPYDEVADYEASVAKAPGVQSELRLQNADLSFVETLEGPLEKQFIAVVRRAFAGQLLPKLDTAALDDV